MTRNKVLLYAGVLVAIVFAAVVFKLHTLTTPVAKIPSKPEVSVPYQPEAQMLVSATRPTESLQRPERATATSSRNTPLPSTYQADLCTNYPDSASHFKCLQKYYQKIVETSGIDVAFFDLKKRYQTDNFVVVQCHPLTHIIGRSAAALYPKVSEAYQHGDSFCWSGYYHGILEGVIKHIGQENLPAQINSICADIPGKETYNFNYYNCVHGLGHGIMELGGDDVFTSLSTCDNLTGAWEKQSCYSGVFMENIIVFERDGSAPDLKPLDPIYPCTAVGEPYKFQCYLGQTSFVLSQNGGDFKKIFAVCASIDGTYRDICGQSIGRDGANYAGHDAEKTRATCDITSEERDSLNCVIGAVKEIISYYHAITQADAYCNILSESEKQTCLSTGHEYYKLF